MRPRDYPKPRGEEVGRNHGPSCECKPFMNTSTLTVGQSVLVNGGFGPVEGKVVKIHRPCIYVETANGRLRFNYYRQECGPDGMAYTYSFNAMIGPGPWTFETPLNEPRIPRS